MSEAIVKSCDVVVIGASASGLPAALRALENGARSVILIDRTRYLGGCARLAAGMFAVESPTQKRYGFHDLTADQAFTLHMELQNWRCDARMVRKWMLGSGDAVQWLENKGVDFNEVSTFNTFDGPHVYHIAYTDHGAMGGNEIVRNLIDACEKQGVELIREVRAYKLLTDDCGKVTGILAHNEKTGQEHVINAKATVICTGAISANDELVHRFFPFDDHSETKVMTRLPHNTGDGFLMAEELGAESVAVGSLLMGPHNHPNNIRVGLLIRRPHPMTVNRLGVRFTDETLYACHPWSWFAGQSLDVQPGKVCYPIYDQKILSDMFKTDYNLYGLEDNQGRIADGADMESGYGGEDGVVLEKVSKTAWLRRVEQDIYKEAEKGRVKIADTLEEIAEFIGCDAETLKKTVAQYNEYCAQGYDRDFLKRKDYLLPISTPPYYCFVGHQGIDTIIGPLKVNAEHQVLHKGDHAPIPGLYAAGVITGGWVNNTYSFPGSCLGYSVWSGYDAGKQAGLYAAAQE